VNLPVGAMLSSYVAPAAIMVLSLSLPHVLAHYLQCSNIGAYANESPMNLAVKHALRRLFTEVCGETVWGAGTAAGGRLVVKSPARKHFFSITSLGVGSRSTFVSRHRSVLVGPS